MAYISQSAFAKLADVTRMTISRAAKAELADAIEPDGKRVNPEHECAIRYLERRKVTKNKKGRKPDVERSRARPAKPASGTYDLATLDTDGISELLDVPMRDILEHHGSVENLQDWLKSIKLICEIDREGRLKRVAQNELIDREFVAKHVFGFVDGVLRRVLEDCPRNITAQVVDALEAGRPREDVTEVIREILQTSLKSLKGDCVRKLA